ncbi:MAG TPA: FMN-binding protein [Nitrospirae bacterium]|nr:FMN-binding protein [Nitrospirota bacterium]
MTFKDIIKITLNLVILYTAAGLLMAAVYSKTSPIIYKKNIEEKKKALQEMMPEADDIVKLGDWYPHEKHAEYFEARKCGELKVKTVKDEVTGTTKEVRECVNPEVIGYIVQTFGKGYSSYINILFSVDTDFVIQKMNVLHHAETPGLGDEIELDWFKNQFKGKDLEHLKVDKTGTKKEYIQAITGATISSRAVAEDGIANGLRFLMKALKGEVEHGASTARGEG